MIHDSGTREKVARLRADTPACEAVMHFNNAGSSLPPRQVVDRVVRHLRLEERIGGYEAAAEVSDELADGYAAIARLVGARPDEIAITDSATRSWLSVFTAVPWREGDRILTAAPEYSSNLIAMLSAAQVHGVTVDRVPSTADGDIDLDMLETMLDDRVRMVAITHAPTNGGLVQPVERIGAVVAGSPALFLVDACQSAGQVPLDLATVGADALSATGRKYLRAPRGTGFLAVRRSVLDRLNPVHVDLDSAWFEDGRVRLRDDARRFELFERNVAAVLGLGEAARYYLDVGPRWVHEYVTALAEHLRDRLTELPGVTVTDIGSHRSGIVSFRAETLPAHELAGRLKERGIHVSVSYASSTPWDMAARELDELVRASVHYYNTPDEVARFCEEVGSALR
ncbi:aminotransferase class V-fold PLP-dependent enzyme [Saccharomonospora cyanea]|uniref:Selenocysteine lyase n=1 Tax=Saccharomonospora cyanea NA-134 TaxID=882082 RepID=H5XMK5_9PSEU|nr:aminotransferase class V-fold PLP-dependent enzyme [Saccharomonospora cyanea]EHR60984.1 selenocysteine lyase [Saccharomonospora cyanea NA-134]